MHQTDAGNSRKAGVDQQLARPSACFYVRWTEPFKKDGTMSTANYPRAKEARVSAADAVSMMNDNDLIVVMAIPDAAQENFDVMYWSKTEGPLPPWIRAKKAA